MRGIIVLASFTHLVAYNGTGIVWKTKQLSWDNLRVIAVGEDELTGEHWDVRSGAKQRFIVDLKTGAATGAAVIAETRLACKFHNLSVRSLVSICRRFDSGRMADPRTR